MIRILLIQLLLCLSTLAAGFKAMAEEIHVRAKLVAEKSHIAPGETINVALVLDHDEKWHTYYLNPGFVGDPPTLKWTLPEGFAHGDLAFPTPKVGTMAGFPFYGYEGETWFLTTLTAPASLTDGDVRIGAEAAWLACSETCVPGDAQLELVLKKGEPGGSDPALAPLFEKARLAMPAAETPWRIAASEDAGEITLTLTAPYASADPGEVRFFGESPIEDATATQELKQDGSTWTLTFPRNPDTEPAPQTIKGILKASKGWGGAAGQLGWAINVTLGDTPPAGGTSPANPDASDSNLGLPLIFSFMFLGGLILNLMPCVFPVIGLKIMGFVQQAGHDRTKIIHHGLVFTAGVLVSFWVLAGILLAGGILNWGGQLENPWVVFCLLLIMLIFGLNMFGVFEVGTSATSVGGKLTTRQGMGGTFFSGILATVVATPCSAPFLGPAIGSAVLLPGPLFMLAFTLMALGLSTPYLVLSIFPGLVDKLPRPGPWMESFKQGMSFLLFGTAGYLLWVYAAQVFEQKAGQKGLWVMLGLTVIACGFWIYGRWDLPHRSPRARWIARLLTLALLATGIGLSRPTPEPVSVTTAPQIEWQPWSKELQDQLIADGKPVYIDFTARWCLTCQTNKAAAYTPAMVEFFKKHGIVPLRADKTNPRPDIDEELRRLNRSAIPVNVFYAPGSDVPHITETLLTADYLMEFLNPHFP
jgi:thiol:disulfide interchange protein DsbD